MIKHFGQIVSMSVSAFISLWLIETNYFEIIFQKSQNCYATSQNMESSYEIMLHLYEGTQVKLLQGYICTQITYLFQNYYLVEDGQRA